MARAAEHGIEGRDALTLIEAHMENCDRTNRAMTQRLDRLDSKMDGLRDEMRDGFKNVHSRISAVSDENHNHALKTAEADGQAAVKTGIYRGLFIVSAGALGAAVTAFGRKLLILVGTVFP